MPTLNSFSDEHNTYIAVDAPTANGCKGCAFDHFGDCNSYIPSYCSHLRRDDNREVIWIVQPQESKEQE